MLQGGRPSELEHCPDERATSVSCSRPDWKYTNRESQFQEPCPPELRLRVRKR